MRGLYCECRTDCYTFNAHRFPIPFNMHMTGRMRVNESMLPTRKEFRHWRSRVPTTTSYLNSIAQLQVLIVRPWQWTDLLNSQSSTLVKKSPSSQVWYLYWWAYLTVTNGKQPDIRHIVFKIGQKNEPHQARNVQLQKHDLVAVSRLPQTHGSNKLRLD